MKRLATIPDKREKRGAFTSWHREAHYDRENGKFVAEIFSKWSWKL
jgi:hypothetical protein